MSGLWTNPNGMVALRATLASLMVGSGWIVFLNWFSGPFHADILRNVPFIWLILAFAGLLLGVQAVLANRHRGSGLLVIILSIPNIPLAAAFSLAAAMAD